MAEAKTKPTKESLKDYLARVEDPDRREDCKVVAAMMQKATGEKPVMWGTGIVGFGLYKVKYANGKEGDWPIIGFAARKSDLTLYVMLSDETVRGLLPKLGKHKSSKACLYIKKLSDVDQPTLKKLVEASVAGMSSQRIK